MTGPVPKPKLIRGYVLFEVLASPSPEEAPRPLVRRYQTNDPKRISKVPTTAPTAIPPIVLALGL